MNTDPTESQAQWHWSKDGATLGPVAFAELKRLAASGSITSSTWVHDPILRRWVAASLVVGLLPTSGAHPSQSAAASEEQHAATTTPSSPNTAPPPSPPPSITSRSQPFTIDPRLAEILCRIAVLTAPLTNIFAVIGVGVVWGLGAADARIIAEARQTMNCLLTLGLGLVIAAVVSFVCAVIIIGPFIGVAITFALFVYCVVIGIRGLIAATNGVPFTYPWIIRFIR